jgi:hypothetical protein
MSNSASLDGVSTSMLEKWLSIADDGWEHSMRVLMVESAASYAYDRHSIKNELDKRRES